VWLGQCFEAVMNYPKPVAPLFLELRFELLVLYGHLILQVGCESGKFLAELVIKCTDDAGRKDSGVLGSAD
jgi:hypothetical protein